MTFSSASFGAPRDAAQWVALAVGVCALASGRRVERWLARRGAVAVLAALAAVLSVAYTSAYLRGGPRIIDATSYWLEARALSRGVFAWAVPEPASAVFGRFLAHAATPDGARAAVLFPPGYPAVLALGFLVGAPLAIGPLIAATLVVATAALAARVAPGRNVVVFAAALSTLCAALRYHTADTMAHGLAALAFVSALAFAFAAIDRSTDRRALAYSIASGFAAGWLVATRPVSGLALAATLVLAFGTARGAPASRRLVPAVLLGAAPGIALLLAYQRATTGSWLLPPQLVYYAQADGPPGCFRYGFGQGIGCLAEHGDFVRANLPNGFGAIEAAATTLRRLFMHLVDAGNVELVTLLVPLAAFVARPAHRVRLLLAAIGLQVAAYVPFYFDGNYPGGGARLYADVLPLEHVLLAVVAAWAAARRPWLSGAVVAIPLIGFAFRAGFDHAALRDRDGGEPMLSRDRLTRAGITEGLVFVDTDHGFNLGYEPPPSNAPLAFARLRGDDIDWMAWRARGEPRAFRYLYGLDAAGRAEVRIEPYVPPQVGALEGESLWPPLRQAGGWVAVEWAQGTCASAGRWLRIHRSSSPSLPIASEAVLALPTPFVRGRTMAPRMALGPGAAGEVTLVEAGQVVKRWQLRQPDGENALPIACITGEIYKISEDAEAVELRLRKPAPDPAAAPREDPAVALDRIELGGP